MFEFETTGTCRYGAGCRFAHVKINTESEADLDVNFLPDRSHRIREGKMEKVN